MIEKSVKKHDRFQFEIKLGYKLKKEQTKTSYNIDSYFFFPDSLGINRLTYSRDIFYKDIHSYIRLKTPTLLLRQITEAEDSPFCGLREGIEQLIAKRDKPSRENYEYHLKMLCSIVKSALRDHVDFIRKPSTEDMSTLMQDFVSESQKVISAYGNLKPLINVPTTTEKSLAIYNFGEEFIFMNIELYSFRLIKIIDKKNTASLKDIRKKIVALIQQVAGSRHSVTEI
ncbi:MAG: hypothetical protein GY765_23955, partial [bacterium]|nr:hypothetical protein [bacterium]